jgi:ribosomal protein S2
MKTWEARQYVAGLEFLQTVPDRVMCKTVRSDAKAVMEKNPRKLGVPVMWNIC